MTFQIILSDTAKKFLKKLDYQRAEQINKAITSKLSTHPRSVGKSTGGVFRELRINKYRVYYTVFDYDILIDKILYQGKVEVPIIGDKTSQRRDIANLKQPPL